VRLVNDSAPLEEDDPSQVEREWDSLWQQARDGRLRFPPGIVADIAHRLRSKLTPDPPDELPDDRLDSESSYPQGAEHTPEATARDPTAGHIASGELVLRAIKPVGRATIFRRRASYSFAPGADDDSGTASERGQAANRRRAVRRAADHALASNCTLWVTLTFDDQHRTDDPRGEWERYSRRLAYHHKKDTGRPLQYVGVISAGPDNREHVHVLLSHDIDPDLVREQWPNGHQVDIQEIPVEDIEPRVHYMAHNVDMSRVTFARFIRSRSSGIEIEDIPVDGIEHGRQVLEDLVQPTRVRLERAQPFGSQPGARFRFDPIRDDG
jgi:hypothetical protein